MGTPRPRHDADLRAFCLTLRGALLELARQEPERRRAYLIAIRWIEQQYGLKPAAVEAEEER